MGQTTHQIAAHIENTRDDLGSNLQELEQRVKSVTDWKEQFRARPMTMLGLAFGSGVVLATAMGRRRAGYQAVFLSRRMAMTAIREETIRSGRPWKRGTT